MYPEIEPFHTEMFPVSDIHTLYLELSGKSDGNPVLFLHGGGGTSPLDRRYFDPSVYKIIVFDQRGSGKSTPHACLDDNNTWSLVSDIEKIRKYLKIEKWIVFGGSWGSTLSLTYAISHPERVKALILRGIFLLRKCELDFLYQSGTSFLFPDYWEGYVEVIPPSERHDLISAYNKYLTGNDEKKKLDCAKAWSKWECATSKLIPDPAHISKAEKDQWAVTFARIENHFFVNKGFFDADDWILKNIDKISNIPGRYDLVCPMKSAWELHKVWRKSTLHIVTNAGHSATEVEISKRLVEAADLFKNE